MKKYLTVLACSVAIGIATNVSLQFQPDSNTAEISLKNIEALAKGEGSSKSCEFTGCVDCPHSSTKVLYVE